MYASSYSITAISSLGMETKLKNEKPLLTMKQFSTPTKAQQSDWRSSRLSDAVLVVTKLKSRNGSLTMAWKIQQPLTPLPRHEDVVTTFLQGLDDSWEGEPIWHILA